MAHKGPNSERNLYGSPHNLWPSSFPAGAKVALFAVLTRQDDAGRTKMDERFIFILSGRPLCHIKVVALSASFALPIKQ
jgi:hypothetical protein